GPGPQPVLGPVDPAGAAPDGGQVEERVGDAGVGPVEDQGAARALGHVGQGQVAVDERGRDGEGGQLLAGGADAGQGRGQGGRLVPGQPGGGVHGRQAAVGPDLGGPGPGPG